MQNGAGVTWWEEGGQFSLSKTGVEGEISGSVAPLLTVMGKIEAPVDPESLFCNFKGLLWLGGPFALGGYDRSGLVVNGSRGHLYVLCCLDGDGSGVLGAWLAEWWCSKGADKT